jgi:hypothetical protein
MVYYKRVRSLRGRIKGVEGWEGGSWRGRMRKVEVGGGGDRKRCFMNTCSCPQEVHYDL